METIGIEQINLLMPLIWVALGVILVMLVATVQRNIHLSAMISGTAMIGALANIRLFETPAQAVTPLLQIDSFGIFFCGLLLSAGTILTVISYQYLLTRKQVAEEFFMLLLLAVLGSLIVVLSNHFVSAFLGIELLSVALYGMIAYFRTDRPSLEAGMKYLIVAAFSTAFMLFGMALMYAQLGTMTLSEIPQRLIEQSSVSDLYWLAGVSMLLVGIGFKMALAPFHMWTPDVYEGAPLPVTALIATISKGAIIAFFVRMTHGLAGGYMQPFILALSFLAIMSMVVGNFMALQQTNVKRLLAYSSIAHFGYLLIAFIVGGSMAKEAAALYITVYIVTILASFAVLSNLTEENAEKTALEDLKGFFWTRPLHAMVLTAAFLSLAGIPFTAGFIGKFYIVTAGVSGSQWFLLSMLVINSTIGLYYYLRVVVAMLSESSGAVEQPTMSFYRRLSSGVLMTVLFALILWLGLFPGPVLNVIEAIGFAL